MLERYRLQSADELWAVEKNCRMNSTADWRLAWQPKALAQQLAYCLRHLDAVEVCGKTGNALNYRRLI